VALRLPATPQEVLKAAPLFFTPLPLLVGVEVVLQMLNRPAGQVDLVAVAAITARVEMLLVVLALADKGSVVVMRLPLLGRKQVVAAAVQQPQELMRLIQAEARVVPAVTASAPQLRVPRLPAPVAVAVALAIAPATRKALAGPAVVETVAATGRP
jgi:hypothetical protein